METSVDTIYFITSIIMKTYHCFHIRIFYALYSIIIKRKKSLYESTLKKENEIDVLYEPKASETKERIFMQEGKKMKESTFHNKDGNKLILGSELFDIICGYECYRAVYWIKNGIKEMLPED